MVRPLSPLRPRHPERGATGPVEFALVLPILMTVFFGVIDGGRMMAAKQMCAYAATVGARTGIASSTASTAIVQNAAVAAAPMLHLATSNVTVTVSGTTTTFSSRARGDKVTVVVTYTFTPVTPILTKLTTKNYSVTSAMVIP